jgi:hypothetical protein
MSGRIRSIKPEWLEDEVLVMMSSDARVLTIALILMADDYGNGRCHVATIAGRVFPPSGDSPEELAGSYMRLVLALAEVTKSRFAGTYEVRGQHYFAIRKWKDHQKVQHPGKPLVPGPPEDFWNVSGESHEVLTPDLDQDQRIDQRPTTNDQHERETPRPKPNDPMRRAMATRPPGTEELFEAWREESGKSGAKFDPARQQLFLRLGADGVTVDEVREATRGAKLDDFALGRNLSPNLILGTADQREKYIAIARDPPRPNGVKAPRQPNGGGFGAEFCAAASEGRRQ